MAVPNKEDEKKTRNDGNVNVNGNGQATFTEDELFGDNQGAGTEGNPSGTVTESLEAMPQGTGQTQGASGTAEHGSEAGGEVTERPTDAEGKPLKTYQDFVDEANEHLTTLYGGPTEEMYEVPKPEKDEYVHDSGWYDRYFPVIDKAEEDQRIKRARNYERAARFTQAGLALANAFNVAGGAVSQKYEPVQFPDLRTWRLQNAQDRKAKAQQEASERNQYTTALRTWNTGKNQVDARNMKSREQWRQLVNKMAKSMDDEYLKGLTLEQRRALEQYRQEQMNKRNDVNAGVRRYGIGVQRQNNIDNNNKTKERTSYWDEGNNKVVKESISTGGGNAGKQNTKKQKEHLPL